MALIMCKECGKDVSKKAKTCPNCGAPIKKSHSFLKLLVIVVFLFIFWGLMKNSVDEDSAQKKTYRFTSLPDETVKKEEQEPIAQAEKLVMPQYNVLDEDVYDIPLKTQVELNILVSGEISEAGLRALLNNLYSGIRAKRGFKYHTSPTNIYIYAFTSKERAESGMGQWIAMLQQSPGDAKPRIDIKKRQIDQLGAEPEEKFGLSENKRRQIFYELVRAGDNATKLALQRYPNDIMKQIDYENKIREANEQKVRGKYNIMKQQMYKIKAEGVTKDWPLPKL